MKIRWMSGLAAIGAAVLMGQALAKATPEQVASLGSDKLTCMGAEKAGSASGVAEYTGKWFKTWTGQTKPFGYEPGPYAAEKPLFTITAQNFAQYAERLTAGQKAMFKAYPDAFRMPVYPSHRDFRPADWVCDVVKHNAAHAELAGNGLKLSGTSGAQAFPFPKSGLEAIWNVIGPWRAWTETAVFDIADVYANGNVAWGRWDFQVLNAATNPDPKLRMPFSEPVIGRFFIKILLPSRQKGEVNVGFQLQDFSDQVSTQAWQYNPGIRRVRKAPEVGYDYPVPPAGLRTSDDDYMFNGSPARYTWKLVGKKEFYVPYNNFHINDPELSYDHIIKPGTVNPDVMRYELHRMWVIEGELKDGLRHVYKTRRIYADEDSWLPYMADNYDTRGQLWRANWIAYFYSQESGTYHRGVSLFHDLTSKAYEATYLVNKSGKNWWRLNQPIDPEQLTPEAAAREGH
jgi:hypothetical protein